MQEKEIIIGVNIVVTTKCVLTDLKGHMLDRGIGGLSSKRFSEE
jgi:hypothetical protein